MYAPFDDVLYCGPPGSDRNIAPAPCCKSPTSQRALKEPLPQPTICIVSFWSVVHTTGSETSELAGESWRRFLPIPLIESSYFPWPRSNLKKDWSPPDAFQTRSLTEKIRRALDYRRGRK